LTGSLWDLIVARARETPHDTMLVDDAGGSLTFAEYRREVEAAAGALHVDFGIGPGSVVSWQLPTWIDSFVLVGALARLGAVQNPIIHIYGEREVGFIGEQAGSELYVSPKQFGATDFEARGRGLADANPGLTALAIDRGGLPKGVPSELPAPPTSIDEVRWYFYTSGTTSDPKGARHTDASIDAVARGMCGCLRMSPDDRHGLVFPFPHIGGIIWLFGQLQVGFPNFIDQAFDPATTVDFLHANDVTLAGAGTYFHQTYLAAQKERDQTLFPSVRGFPGGGAPKPPQLHHAMREAWPGSAGILSGYGLTEAPILTMATPDDPDDKLADTEGRALPGVELKLVGVDGQVCGPGEEGEVRAKAPQMMQGYLDGSLDADAFDDGGWFRTGDLGVLDEDGFLTITGRLKDVIIRKGENVSAKRVEDALFGHDAVADVAVIGLPDEDTGERVCAVVVTTDGGELTFEQMQQHLEGQQVMKRAWPEQLELVDVLPRNASGKVLKYELRERFASAPFSRR